MEEEIKKMILEKYGSMRSFSDKIGLSNSTVVSILDRGLMNSNITNVIAICKGLNISVDKLVDDGKIISVLNFDNAEILNYDSNRLTIPVLGVIKAGTPIEAQQNILEYIDIPKEWSKGNKRFYALKISGDSMSPKYQPNDIVVFEQNDDVIQANGKECAIMVNGDDATFKKFTLSDNGIILTPLNQDNSDGYQTTFYSAEQVISLPVKVIGIAVEKRTRL